MADAKEPIQSVQVFGRKKTATAVAYCKRGKGIIRVNGKPLEQIEPKPLQFKLQEPILLLGKDRFSEVDIRIRVKDGHRWWTYLSKCHLAEDVLKQIDLLQLMLIDFGKDENLTRNKLKITEEQHTKSFLAKKD